MRILVVAACPLPWPRGTPIRIHRMAEALFHRGHDVHVATYPLGDHGTPTPYKTHRIGHANMRIAPEPGPSMKKLCVLDPMLVLKVKRLLDEMPFDVIHAHHYEGLVAALMARRSGGRIPIVFDAHTLLASELPYYRLPLPGKLTAWIGLRLDSKLPRRADHVIAVTERMREWFTTVAAIPADRISLIPNGVEHEHFAAPVREHKADGSAATGDKLLRVVFTGNLAEYQGIDLLLQAFKQVWSEVRQARLILVTDSNLASLTRQIMALGLGDCVSTVYADYASLPLRLAEADVLVNPRPRCEGIPQKLLNYMAAGRPIVSFAGSAALLEHERTALLVPDDDIAALALAILRILNEPQLGERLGQAARTEVIATYGWRHAVEKVETVYSQVTGSTS